ncbi:small acid-soluble spore protein N [Salinibacillus xinjiangensis]|uniref:Acid-soluble spore protein N n=1 Tax=Salinibacillus xinjiangensis TaxID=1229268 RepID=A0A6G1X310_9BACI|nr:small acid-soluble spore protein N [Salinibacillus xinjiangensis]MRG85286.1 acid-soluble spore protein N [Salinibacillus xinjiangensis]
MGNPKKDTKHFRPNKHGKLSMGYDGNKGRKYQTKGREQTQWIQPKGN